MKNDHEFDITRIATTDWNEYKLTVKHSENNSFAYIISTVLFLVLLCFNLVNSLSMLNEIGHASMF